MKIGVLALQGDFEAHQRKLSELGVSSIAVRSVDDFSGLDGFIIPGGESTAIIRLLKEDLSKTISNAIRQGLPTFVTCAGAILLASKVENPKQESLGLIDITIQRNGYGRQIDSFIAPVLKWTKDGEELVRPLEKKLNKSIPPPEGVFIRAPIISQIGANAQAILTFGQDKVLVREKSILAATFHPELSPNSSEVHQLFLSMI